MTARIGRRTVLTQIAGTALSAATLAYPIGSSAQGALPDGWPNRPVKLVIPSGPGAQTDLFARYVADDPIRSVARNRGRAV